MYINQIIRTKTIFIGVLVFLFFVSNSAFAYSITPDKSIDIDTVDVLDSFNAVNKGNTLDVQELINASLKKTLENLDMTLPSLSSLPLGKDLESKIFDFSSLSFDDAGSIIKSVVVLIFKILLLIVTTIAQVLKAFIDIII